MGGIAENDRQYLNVVEVLDLSTMTWMKADPVPKPVTFMPITACSVTNRIYLLGGLTQRGAIKSVFSCYIPDLITSCQGKTETLAWEVITDAPFVRSGGAAINGKLVTASGLNSTDMTTSTMHAFDPNTKSGKLLEKWQLQEVLARWPSYQRLVYLSLEVTWIPKLDELTHT